ncbi:MAG: lysyl-tRNA synthetase [Candidatus Nomurabacteria bacterium GW2011_GWE1_32_28]|uniref:Lysine--tRNA ligase n=1 Tax=Candidatus Nomurabacteria bacterium GW2011_GWF1_31_48 TaxID=1618767 RepID=A0A0F9YVQ0_9BACT|nr:MAG: lysyl-tRNA synthetase [Candidatus Nomurabacteria bacterium GW2011_GWF2_30_133]KKP29064.1 MAG: lysyl-tRNA synthetase [Candidatus Nomurabacteria bacterium GW2011_GWE2_31_40]KKP30526.1 MAG: lysyl-tRNA synthetase [Candidatus Nomurabacteria bacterium GW2011_GWF1_31_48]KKP35011.1 MAG: lysyl-tRNA synthetase [Candidatus Nomurabacteria bacterium GW2011_GWE1_32_28]HAS80621.1 lysine--tRNA ligase [Candidatus Nomurabacteria bacterium]
MSSIDEIRDIRIKKIKLLRDKGIDPYPAESKREISLRDAVDGFVDLEKNKDSKWISGRIMSIRGQGAIIFLTLNDGTALFQGLLKKDIIGDEKFDFFNEVIDIGDFIEIFGTFFATKRGEKTVEIKDWVILSKSLLPLPEKWHGLQDVEERFRKRYLDILMDPEVKEIFIKKAKFWNVIREYLISKGFLEVETPVIENTTGGADARPFVTHHNALDIDVYLRISAGELWQKKLLVAGFPKTFEIGRIFRNEGISNEHLQDYTQLEYYMAYSNYQEGMKMTKELYRLIAEKVFGTTKFSIRGFEIDLNAEWKIYDFSKIIEDRFGFNPSTDIYLKTGKKIEEKELKKICENSGVEYDRNEYNISSTADLLWKSIRKEFMGPGFLIGVPVSMEPLAKKNLNNPNIVERFQVILAGSEMGKGFSELNDPIDQRERFKNQQALRDAGDDEAQMADMEFVEALEYAMPPAFGFGLSERLFSFLVDKPIRETQLFPLMKPKNLK